MLLHELRRMVLQIVDVMGRTCCLATGSAWQHGGAAGRMAAVRRGAERGGGVPAAAGLHCSACAAGCQQGSPSACGSDSDRGDPGVRDSCHALHQLDGFLQPQHSIWHALRCLCCLSADLGTNLVSVCLTLAFLAARELAWLTCSQQNAFVPCDMHWQQPYARHCAISCCMASPEVLAWAPAHLLSAAGVAWASPGPCAQCSINPHLQSRWDFAGHGAS